MKKENFIKEPKGRDFSIQCSLWKNYFFTYKVSNKNWWGDHFPEKKCTIFISAGYIDMFSRKKNTNYSLSSAWFRRWKIFKLCEPAPRHIISYKLSHKFLFLKIFTLEDWLCDYWNLVIQSIFPLGKVFSLLKVHFYQKHFSEMRKKALFVMHYVIVFNGVISMPKM